MPRIVSAVVALVAALTGLSVLIGLGPLSARAAAPETFYAVNDTFAFTGHGYGHGLGMSQNGAYAAAVSGLTAAQILDFYYPGTVSAPESQVNTGVRVLVSGGDGASMQISPQTRDGALTVTDYNTGASLPLPSAVGAASVASWRMIAAGDGTIRLQGFWSGGWQPFPAGAGWSSTGAVAFSSSVSLLTLIRADGTLRDYPGALAAAPNGATGIFTIDLLTTEDYLRGVVPSESPSSWPAAALQAQTIAARTYAAKVSNPTRLYDICDTTSCQVFSGLATYGPDGRLSRATTTANTDSAITATAGQIRTYAGAPILAQYSASNGGWTVAGDSFTPYLVAKADPYDGAIPNSSNSWTQNVDATTLGTAVGVGRAYALTVNGRDGNGDWGGRITSVTVAGATGTVTVSGETFRSDAGLKSTWWTAPPGTAAGAQSHPGMGSSDLFAVGLNNNASQTVEVHSLSKATNYASFDGHSTSAFAASNAADWRFFIAPFNGDGQPDLYGVRLRGTGSGDVEVHVLSAASNYQTFLLHAATGIGALPAGASADIAFGPYNGDGQQDMYFIPWGVTGSGDVEVHTLSAASSYQSFIAHFATGMATSMVQPGQWTFLVGDSAGRGDLVAVHGSGTTGSGRTEVHVLSQASGYQTWTLHAATALGLWPADDVAFGLGDFDKDGSDDLFAILRGATTPNHSTEVHVLSGADSFQTFVDHAATALGRADASSWQFGIG